MQADLYFALGALVSCVYIITIVVIVTSFQEQDRRKSPSKTYARATLPFVRLRDGVEQLSGLLTAADTDLKKFQLDLEDYGAKNWNREKELEGNYQRIADNLFLLIDHLENTLKDKKKSDEVDWIYRRTRRILEDEGIGEILVNKGDNFNGAYHKNIGSRPDELPKSTILEVTRKGYCMKSNTEEDIILRPAEVIVSSGFSGNSQQQ